mgnify:CR=1 FL=1
MNIKAVVFDMDGLMIDSERIIRRAWGIVGRQLGYGDLGEDMYYTMGLNVVRREKYFKDKYGEDFPFDEFLDAYRHEYHMYVREHGIDAKPGLYEILETLKELGIPMAVATSTGRDNAIRNLKDKNVDGYFDVMVCGDMVNDAKPSPEIYQKACELLGVMPGDAIALEDSLNGVRSAFAAGMQTIMIPDLIKDTSEAESMIFMKMDSLSDVSEWIRKNMNA